MINRSDNFDRANTTAGLGTPSDGGPAWVQRAGDMGIIDGAAYCPDGDSPTIHTLNSEAVNFRVGVTMRTYAQFCGLTFSYVDANNYGRLILSASGKYELQIIVNGSEAVNLQWGVLEPVSGVSVWVERNESDLKAAVDGVERFATVSEALRSSQEHGLFGFGQSLARYEDFYITGLGGGTPTGPTITTQPSNASVTAPATASFAAAATGADAGGWQVDTLANGDWQDIAGSAANSLTTGATAVSTGTYRNGTRVRAWYSNGGGARVYSNPATITVAAAALSVTVGFTGENDVPVGAITIPKVFVIRYSDNALVHTFTNVNTNSSGQVTLSHSSLTAVPHVFVPANNDSTPKLAGGKFYIPA